jgi:hypothetical protein
LASSSQNSGSAARPFANVAATRDGDIAAGSRNAAHTVFDHRTPTFGCEMQEHLFVGAETALQASEHAASAIVAR